MIVPITYTDKMYHLSRIWQDTDIKRTLVRSLESSTAVHSENVAVNVHQIHTMIFLSLTSEGETLPHKIEVKNFG